MNFTLERTVCTVGTTNGSWWIGRFAGLEAVMKSEFDARKEFLSVFEKIAYRHNAWEVWSDFVTMFGCAISNAVDKPHFGRREEMYLQLIKKYEKDDQARFPQLVACIVEALEQNPEQDFLGKMFMELKLGSKHKGQFFTSYDVSLLTAEITFGDILGLVNHQGYATIHDPCCGSGGMFIAALNMAKRQLDKVGLNFQNCILIVGQEIDFAVAMMAYIQVSLLGVAGYFKVGDALSDPMTENDSMENYWFTPMYFSPVWAFRRVIQKMNERE